MTKRCWLGFLTVALTIVVVGASGCATTAHYPTRELERGEVMTSGTLAALSYVPSQLTLQVLYGFEEADAGVHAGLEGGTMEGGQFVPQFAVGGSYRRYLEDWIRLAAEVTYHRAPSRLRREDFPIWCRGYEPSFWSQFREATECFVVDDWLKTRGVLQFAGDWGWGAVHGGPLARTGVWIADPGRRELDRSTEILRWRDSNAAGRSGGWTGFQMGVSSGAAWYATDWLTLQVDAQVLAPVAGWIAPGVTPEDREFADPAGTFMDRNKFRANFSVQVAF